MAVFFVHDVGKGIVTPLDRKFRLREIEPTEELNEIQRIHPKTGTSPEDFKGSQQKGKHQSFEANASQQKAIAAYQETRPARTPLGRVKSIMTSPVISISIYKTLEDAWKLMQQHGIHHLVILDGQQNYCGMLSEKTIVPFLMKKNTPVQAHSENTLEPFCHESLLSTNPETAVEDLAPAFLEFGLDAIAVNDNQQIIGIVTYPDIIKTILLNEPINANA